MFWLVLNNVTPKYRFTVMSVYFLPRESKGKLSWRLSIWEKPFCKCLIKIIVTSSDQNFLSSVTSGNMLFYLCCHFRHTIVSLYSIWLGILQIPKGYQISTLILLANDIRLSSDFIIWLLLLLYNAWTTGLTSELRIVHFLFYPPSFIFLNEAPVQLYQRWLGWTTWDPVLFVLAITKRCCDDSSGNIFSLFKMAPSQSGSGENN